MSHQDPDSGFTLIEVLVTLVLLGLMMAIAVTGWSSWASASAHSGAAREIQTVLRQAHQQAITQGRAMCVWFDVAANSYTVYRGACDDAAKQQVVGPYQTDDPAVELAGPAFTAPSGTSAGVTFYARGTAWPGQVSVTRSGSGTVYALKVEGLTGRVSLT